MTTHALNDASVMLGRSIRHVTRRVDTIITVTIMPIAFLLLFRYVFGGAIQAGTGNCSTAGRPATTSGGRWPGAPASSSSRTRSR